MLHVKCFAVSWKQAGVKPEEGMPSQACWDTAGLSNPAFASVKTGQKLKSSRDEKQEIPVPSPTTALLH